MKEHIALRCNSTDLPHVQDSIYNCRVQDIEQYKERRHSILLFGYG
jgi:hypothetical protein